MSQAIEKEADQYFEQVEKINNTKTSLIEKVEEMCNIFKDLVENNGLDFCFIKIKLQLLEKQRMNVKAIQLVFYGVSYFSVLQII